MEEEMKNVAAIGQVDKEFENPAAATQVEEDIENAMSVEMEEYEPDARVEGIITQFNPDHIITDPGLRIPVDQFSVDIRAEVRRAFIAKGPTQAIAYNFPQTKDNKRF
jgi:hypothetical protein